MKRIGFIVALNSILLLSIGFLFLSCSSHNKEKKYRIGFSQCTNDVWRKNMQDEMEREFSFYPEVNLIVKNANLSSAKQIEQINELMADKIDLLIVSPNEAQPLTPTIERVFKTGLPVIVVDRNILSDHFTAFIGANNYKVGTLAGAYANSLLHGHGNILEVNGLLKGSSADIGRNKGFRDFIKDYPGLSIKARCIVDTINHDKIDQLTEYLKKDSNIDFVYCHDDRVALASYNLINNLGLADKIKIIGIDGLPGKNNGIDLVEKKILNATILYPSGGKESIQTAINILEGKPYDKFKELAISIIDSSNVRIVRLQNEKLLDLQADIDKRQKKIEEQIVIANNQLNIIIAISISLALAVIFGGILYYYLGENKKINKQLELKRQKIADQRNQLVELMAELKTATNAKFNFFTNISHELRTPLTLVIAPLEDALASPKLHFTIKNNLEFIYRNTFRLLRLINQLMDFRKIEENKMSLRTSEINITDFVTDITIAFHDLAKKKSISFNVMSRVKGLNLWFDPAMLDKVLYNLFSNAFKFTAENGTINVLIDETEDRKTALIKIADSGIGMNSQDAQHAFDLFYQGHSGTFKGTGLGLSLSKELINLHHGTITVTSEKGKGTTFEIRMPIGNAHLKPEEILSEAPALVNTYEDLKIYTSDIEPILFQQEESITGNKEYSILLIEDNHDLRTFLSKQLGNLYEIHETYNGDEGIKKAFDIVPDLIISDIIMSGQNGLQVTETLKQDIRTSHIPIILLTAKGGIENQIKGIRSRADAFILKPFNLEYLRETIKNLLNNRMVLREHYTSELPTESRSNSSTKIDRKFINEFTAIVEKNLSNEKFSIEDIFREIGISKVQLYRKVKALIGFNINDYILNVRMQKAKYLLTDRQLSISEVAYRVGFSSQAYFSTVFKSKFLMTPSEYREKKITGTTQKNGTAP
jgi:signal transduction histidine kinase/AraC-like DNA-binding protein